MTSEGVYRIAGVRGFGKGVFAREQITGGQTSYKMLHRMTGGQFVMSRLKAFEGAIALVPDEFDGWFASPEFPTFSLREGTGESRYVKHLFGWQVFWEMLRGESKGIGARRERVSAERLLALRVPLPHVHEQRRIADKLDAAMDRIARVVQLKKQSDAIVRQHADSLLRSVDQVTPLGSALHVDQDFVNVSSDEKYAVTGIYSFGKGLIRRPVIQGSETAYPRFARLREGQVVMSKLNAWEGALAVVDEGFAGTHVSPEYPVLSVDTGIAHPEYIGHLLAWPELWSRLTPRGSMVRRKRTTPATLLATEVPLPSLPEQRRIAERLTLARRVAEAGAQQVADTEALRKGLLDAAFSGRL
ncbi:restriction endonuclease subunit S [Streptomyces niveus]|uniref:restriction endonuclease subunit S n=1 Tax=Streptomyces niveus TaxID=193462 RepID=UPI0037225860